METFHGTTLLNVNIGRHAQYNSLMSLYIANALFAIAYKCADVLQVVGERP